MSNEHFWKRKLLAYLHDPPSKCLDIAEHTTRSREAMSRAGFSEAEIGKYASAADHAAAAADRFPFPRSQSANLSCVFDGVRNGFIHPLAGRGRGAAHMLTFHKELEGLEGIEGDGSEVQPCWQTDSVSFDDPGQAWKARFFLHWRLWPQLAMEKEYRWKFLPADTRMPDHSIWTHMGVVSALAGCDEDAHQPLEEHRRHTKLQVAFLKFQMGPVQDFIEAARSTRDLWSGSYLLSWLMATGLQALADEVGPDAVIFPNLWGQPLFDLRYKESLWDKVHLDRGRGRGESAWKAYMKHDAAALLTPNLPNVFLAVVPAARAEAIAERVKQAIATEWDIIGASVWSLCEEAELMGEDTLKGLTFERRRERFDRQLKQHLSVSWQVTPWPDSLSQADALCSLVPETDQAPDSEECPSRTSAERFRVVVKAATEDMRIDDRDKRYYTDENETVLNNVGLAWSRIYGLNGWALDATRRVRDFHAWADGGWDVGLASNKDSLTGKEEAVAGGREWKEKCEALGKGSGGWGTLGRRFKKDDWLGAVTLVKRLWDLSYLKEKWGLDPLRMPNTRGLARHAPFSQDEDEVDSVDSLAGEKYFAVLAFDGDQIGQWVSGAKTPCYADILADYEGGGALEYFKRYSGFGDLLKTRRLLSPSYHLQLSEALSNFAVKCAASVVEAHYGRLIYAGGDDVLAMVPADTAIACARDLLRAFQGEKPLFSGRRKLNDKRMPHTAITDKLREDIPLPPGFLGIEGDKTQDGFQIPFIVPGPAVTASVGIAIAHFKSPLQDVVREARKAEKRAKKVHGRDALAVTLLKRSGETVHWGCQWKSKGVDLYERLFEAGKAGDLSSRFPYRLVQLLTPYLCPQSKARPGRRSGEEPSGGLQDYLGFEASEVILCEARHALAQHCSRKGLERDALVSEIVDLFIAYVAATKVQIDSRPNAASALVEQVIGLCQTVAFASRNVDQDQAAGERNGSHEAA